MKNLDWKLLVILCLTIGLAPFTPPHVVEKGSFLLKGKPLLLIDWFDLFMHGLPWLLLAAKAVLSLGRRSG